MKLCDSGANYLRYAIVQQAVIDIAFYTKRIDKMRANQTTALRRSRYYEAEKILKEAKEFLRSDWFEMLMDLDGEQLIKLAEGMKDSYVRKEKNQ